MADDLQYYDNVDIPVMSRNDDKFDTSIITKGLVQFIRKCNTPMTLSIQGEWGCGKTSIMNMVREGLEEDGKSDNENGSENNNKNNKAITIWFNTWQFSQFNMAEQLPITFLSHLSKKLEELLPKKEGLTSKTKEKITKTLKAVTLTAVKHYIGNEVGELIENITTPEETDLITQLDTLKSDFEDLINEVLEANKDKGRVVIFVDDLDRIQPIRALDLLEILKIFLDCKNCVFVLAIDTSVVYQGIRAKYGQDISEEKMQSFFDKIIQAPFKVPINHYNLTPTLRKLVPYARHGLYQEDYFYKRIDELEVLLTRITNGNPRSIKRLSNIFQLETAVADLMFCPDGLPKAVVEEIFLILSGLQMRFMPAYNFLMKSLSVELLISIAELDINSKYTVENSTKMNTELAALGMEKFYVSDSALFFDTMYALKTAIKSFVGVVTDYSDDMSLIISAYTDIVLTLGNFSTKKLPNTSERCTRMIKETLESYSLAIDDDNIETIRQILPTTRDLSDADMKQTIDFAVQSCFTLELPAMPELYTNIIIETLEKKNRIPDTNRIARVWNALTNKETVDETIIRKNVVNAFEWIFKPSTE